MHPTFVAFAVVLAVDAAPTFAQTETHWSICLDELPGKPEMTITRPFSVAAKTETGTDANLSLALKLTEIWRDHHPREGSNGTICQVGTKQEVEAAFQKFRVDPARRVAIEDWTAKAADLSPTKLTAFRGFASCFLALHPNAGASVAYLTSSFASSRYETSDQQKYIDAFARFLASKYPSPGNGAAQADCNFSTSASDAEQMSDQVLQSVGIADGSIVRTGWQP